MDLTTARWVAGSFDEPDLCYANEYYAQQHGNISSFYEPYLAMIPCESVEKPAIFVRVPEATLKAFSQSVQIKTINCSVIATARYAVLWIRILAQDDGGAPIRSLVPSTILVSAPGYDDTVVPFDLFLDIADPFTQRWLSAWAQWPNSIFFFVLESRRNRIACFIDLNWPPAGWTEMISNNIEAAQTKLAQIPAEKRDYSQAASVMREVYWNRLPLGTDAKGDAVFDVYVSGRPARHV